jgi:hypothetical protein
MIPEIPIPEEDSPDLTDEEIERAVPTDGPRDISRGVLADFQESPGIQLEGHELRRRKPHLYWRVKLLSAAGVPRTLIFQADWLQQKT